jgi:hypothetical protein
VERRPATGRRSDAERERTTRLVTRGSLAALLVLGVARSLAAQADVTVLVERVSTYVETFQRDFGSMVAEERYEQAIRQALGATRSARGVSGPTQTVLVSDFLLVQVPGEGWLPFRDVFERDGQRVRDREERLSALFLSGGRDSLAQAKKIMDEGARYNIGNVQRNINVPTLPLPFVTPPFRARFAFTIGKREDDGLVLNFRETGRPTYIATTGGRNLPVEGRYWVDPESGVIRKTELVAVDTDVEARITVTYQLDPGTRLWVPGRMEERYRRARDSNEVRGTATYTRFRRFQVSTETSDATEATAK